MSVIVAQSLHIFGLRSRVANNVCYFDEQIIIYPSGNSCVKYHLEQKWQKFIQGNTPSLSQTHCGCPYSHSWSVSHTLELYTLL
uniref:Uncharacterized protein n=1 Tax=Gopherus agassizii TaxID=38772 RepID=A0A452IBP8_9SAUR